jgi:hypothetical protein
MTTTNEVAPWYRDAAKIPADIRAAAEQAARELSEDDSEFKWRMRNWEYVMIGYAHNVRIFRPHFMMSPADALAWMRGLCNHKWVKARDWNSESKELGTYDRGYINCCSKCGKEDYVRTAYNNYSGD